jgi:hypothetical protein
MTVHLAVSREASGKRRAVISGQDLEFHRVVHITRCATTPLRSCRASILPLAGERAPRIECGA